MSEECLVVQLLRKGMSHATCSCVGSAVTSRDLHTFSEILLTAAWYSWFLGRRNGLHPTFESIPGQK